MRMKVALIIFMVSVLSLINCSAQPSEQDSKRGSVIVVSQDGKHTFLYEKSYALLIGISKYSYWNNLTFIPQEMMLLKSALEKQGFIVDMHENLVSAVLKETIEDFISKKGVGSKQKNNRLLIFFSGHGCTRKISEQNIRGYIVPSDAPRPKYVNDFVRTAIEMEQIRTWAKRIESKHALFIFDSCFSGTIFTDKSYPTSRKDIKYLTGRPVRQFITAGDEKQRVPGESIFLQCLIRGIEGDAINDRTKDFYITGTDLGRYLQRVVPTYNTGHIPQFGKLNDPKFDRGDFVFILNSEPPPPPAKLQNILIPTPTPRTPNGECFESPGCEITVTRGEILKVSGNFVYSNDNKYWLAFIDDDRIWPMVEISRPEIIGTAKVPTTGFNGGKLVLICVQDVTHERFKNWSSHNPLIRPGELSIILETKINIQ